MNQTTPDSSDSPDEKPFPWLAISLNLGLAVGAGALFWYLFLRDAPPAPKVPEAPPPTNVSRTSIAPMLGEKGDTGLPKLVYPVQEELLGDRLSFKGVFSLCPPLDWAPLEIPPSDDPPQPGVAKAVDLARYGNPSGRGFMSVRHIPRPEIPGGIETYLKRMEEGLRGKDGANYVVREDFEHGGTVVTSFVMMSEGVTLMYYFFHTADGGAFSLDYGTETSDLTQPVASLILSSLASARIMTVTE